MYTAITGLGDRTCSGFVDGDIHVQFVEKQVLQYETALVVNQTSVKQQTITTTPKRVRSVRYVR